MFICCQDFYEKKNGTLNDDNLFKTSVEIEISQE